MPEMSPYPEAIRRIIAYLKRLPGIGGRTAERLTFALLEWPDELLQGFGDELRSLREHVRECATCGNFADGETCTVCAAPNRERDRICVVEYATQIPVIEASGSYRGLYHVLGGRIVPLEGKGPEDLRIAALRERVAAGGIGEVILATSPDVEGEATAHYVAAELEEFPVRLTRIASGIPVGADLGYADAATVAMALGARRELR